MLPPDLPLLERTDSAWVDVVLADFPRFLQDHASCERKAAAQAMSFVAKYSEYTALIEPMVALAREELEHFHQVFRLMQRRGVALPREDAKDPYVNAMLPALRHGRDERFLDRLILSALIEARSHERFDLLAAHLDEPELARFYRQLADREAGHYKIFERLAQHFFPRASVAACLSRLAAVEADALRQTPLRATVH